MKLHQRNMDKTAIFRLSKVKDNMSDADKMLCLANNTGNMVFDNALGKIIKGESVYDYFSQEELAKYDRFITTSYIWIRQNQPIHSCFSKIGDKPYIPMSVGLQASEYDPKFILHPDVVRELTEISERCVIGCRGYYTAEILNKYGIKNTMVIGCPSVYTNMFDNQEVPHKPLSKAPKLSANFITLWRTLKKNEQEFLKYACDHEMSFIEQTSNELKREYLNCSSSDADKIENWIKNEKIFYSYDEWAEFIKEYEFSFGFRFHGNVIALNNHVPALFIYSDSRVKEMCEFFHFPMISANEFDCSKPIEYWYEKADYSEFNKTQNKRIENLKEFCKKNNIELNTPESVVNKCVEPEKIIVSSATSKFGKILSNEKYEFGKVWKRIDFEGKSLFMSDGKTIWQHLKIRLPYMIRKGNEYYINFRVKFRTSSESIRFFIQNSNGGFQQLCYVNNKNTDDYYEISTCFLCNDDYDYIRVTSSDFIGENYFVISDIDVHKLTISSRQSDNTLNSIMFYMGVYAECSCGYGSLLDFLHDVGESQFSIFVNNEGLMKAMHGMAWESGLTIYLDISQRLFGCELGNGKYTTVLLDSLLDNKVSVYNKDIPIIICSDTDDFIRKKLHKLSSKVYNFYDIYRYAVAKNCIIGPAKQYFKDQSKNVRIIEMYLTMVNDIEQPSEYEKRIMTHNYEKPYDVLYDDPTYKDKIKDTSGPFWIGTGKKMSYINVTNDNCLSFNGIRRTFYQPENYTNSIWFIGTSVSSGAGYVVDEHTIESNLQNILNEKKPSRYIVHNVIMPCGWHYGNYFKIIKQLPIEDNDLVIFSDDYSSIFKNEEFLTPQIRQIAYFLDIRKYFQRPHDLGEIFVDLVHMTPKGYRRYAEAIYNELSENNLFDNNITDSFDDNNISHELQDYIRSIVKYKKPGLNGCIVMNCNPFTLGHRYLIEYASKQVDNLYVFVVEEDKSMFKFADRFMLVQKGTEDIPNVTVIPSGKFIISALTFKAYFEKGEKQDVVIDTSQDLTLFGKYIAPALNISIRFAGSEPLDNITNQYNAGMKLLLPKYNVQFIEIPRKEKGGTVISASRVRNLLKSKDYDELSKLVPKTTLDFLRNTYGN